MSKNNAGTEVNKTLMFVGAAALSLGAAFFTAPPKVSNQMDDEVGKVLFEGLSDPTAANGLEVLSYNEELAELKRFKVVQKDGIWVIPSYEDYPADAQDQLVNAATMFTDLNIVGVVSENEADHKRFGVVEPNPDKTQVGDEGVGTLVNVFGDADGSQTKLASVVIGKEVNGSEGQHYVRRPGKSRVYQVKIDPTQLSTKFEDWIETDLLKVNSWDVAGVTIRDYSMDVQQQSFNSIMVAEDRRFDLTTSFKDNKWVIDSLTEYTKNVPREALLEPGEELKKDRLDTLKNALSELKIVDVERKPKGLGADLRADKSFMSNPENQSSLAARGFYPLRDEDDNIDLRSGDGELLVNTKEGVQYVLRFGRIAGLGDASEEESAEKSEGSLNRYMFVSVRLNEAQFPMPELEPLPEGADALEAEETPEDSSEEKSEDESEKDAGGEEKKPDNELALQVANIKKANQRKIDERNDKIEAAKKKVAELTYRFADWYYVVPDDVFKKLRLRRDDVIAFSEEALKAGNGMAAFRNLQKEGLKPTPETEQPKQSQQPINVLNQGP